MKFHIYQDTRTGDWKWKVKAPNGIIIGQSTENYKSKEAVLLVIDKILKIKDYIIEGDDKLC